jgi:metacaspase-1
MNYALSVGINKYKTPGNDLNGCVNDVMNIRRTLTELYGFSVLGFKSLVDQAATKEAIMTALKIMVTNSVAGDHLVYHHSSHGSQVEDQDGDEADGLDEILCPYDFDWDGTYITDDELRDLIFKLKRRVTLDVILDSCHSGTAIRSLEVNSKFIEPIFVPKGKPLVNGLLRGILPTGVTLWAGCRANQTSADARIDGAYHGAMTYYLCKSLRDGNGNIRRSTVYSKLKKYLRNEYEQIPQLECTVTSRYKKVFT